MLKIFPTSLSKKNPTQTLRFLLILPHRNLRIDPCRTLYPILSKPFSERTLFLRTLPLKNPKKNRPLQRTEIPAAPPKFNTLFLSRSYLSFTFLANSYTTKNPTLKNLRPFKIPKFQNSLALNSFPKIRHFLQSGIIRPIIRKPRLSLFFPIPSIFKAHSKYPIIKKSFNAHKSFKFQSSLKNIKAFTLSNNPCHLLSSWHYHSFKL